MYINIVLAKINAVLKVLVGRVLGSNPSRILLELRDVSHYDLKIVVVSNLPLNTKSLFLFSNP